ncbi:helix-turn-helix domain-containing protein [Leptospira interrogans]|uniref:PF06114 domain protein n=5 Tax=Leptospira interrogans TaxID=173 RepID=A0A0E2D598_LEPIR|nr:XRE family transcriptional regulator [Leptospira interrogans]EKR55182.1 PF06114 domain protein [Leptospira interrogans str. UI 12758]
MSISALITPEVLKWARTSAKYSIEEVAQIQGFTKEKLIRWESGESRPTVKQLEKLAKQYNRPISVFYLPKPPYDFTPLRDFRKGENYKNSQALLYIIREITEKQKWMSSFLQSIGHNSLPFVGKFNINSEYKEVANYIKEYFGFQDFNWKNNLQEVMFALESKGLFISRSSNFHSKMILNVEEVRGLAIVDKYAPFIFINSRDAPVAQLFTLFHEVAHISIDSEGISNIDSIDYQSDLENKYDKAEILCNRIASEILIPEEEVKNQIKLISKVDNNFIDQYSNSKGISRLAVATKLMNLKYISKETYNSLIKKYRIEYENSLKKTNSEDKKRKPNWYYLQRSRNSINFSKIVMSGFYVGNISGVEASSLLGVKVSNFKKYIKYLS